MLGTERTRSLPRGILCLHIKAAVYVEDLAGDVAGMGGVEEEDGGSDVLDFTETTGGDLGDEVFGDFFGQAFMDFRVDEAGGDGIGGDLVSGQLAGGDFRQRDEAGFAGGIVGRAQKANL